MEKLRTVFQSPKDHPQEMVILLGVGIALLFLILVLIAIFLIKEPSNKLRIDKKKVLKKSIVVSFVWLILFLIAAGTGAYYTGGEKYCSKCHYEKQYIKSLKSSPHKSVICLSCHKRPGVLGYMNEKLLVLQRLGKHFKIFGAKHNARGFVSNNACLTCHGDIEDRVIAARGTRVAHRQIIDKGFRCTECHNQVGHGKLIQPVRNPRMEDCMECHNGKVAFSDCQGCHTERIPVKGKLSEYRKINDSRGNNCNGCHTTEKCINCHGRSFPHPEAFYSEIGGHKMYPQTDQCGTCHGGMCDQCHS